MTVAMTPFEHGAVAFVLLGSLAFLIGMGAAFLALNLHERRRERTAGYSNFANSGRTLRKPPGGFRPLFYELPRQWVAVRTPSVAAVQEALRLQNAARGSWQDTLAGAGDRAVFLTPSIMGWVLIVGPGVPDPADDIDECYHFLVQLSRALGQVQLFSSHAALGHHAWAKLNGGEIERAYAWAGETLWNQGPLSRTEQELGMICFDYNSQPNGPGPTPECAVINAEKLALLAGRWSINPTGIDERVGGGIIGESARVRPC